MLQDAELAVGTFGNLGNAEKAAHRHRSRRLGHHAVADEHNATIAAKTGGTRQNGTVAIKRPPTIQLCGISSAAIGMSIKPIRPSAATASTPSRAIRASGWLGSMTPGRQSTASAIRIGYSATQLNTYGAISAGRDAADHAAGRHPHVERGEVARRRPPPRQFAVAHQRADEEHGEMQRDQTDDWSNERVDDGSPRPARDEQPAVRSATGPVRNDRSAREHDHEGQEIERERHHPQQRHRGDVGRDVRGDRDQQPGGDGRERDPARIASARAAGASASRVHVGFRSVGAPHSMPRGRDQRDQQHKTGRPNQGLVTEPG